MKTTIQKKLGFCDVDPYLSVFLISFFVSALSHSWSRKSDYLLIRLDKNQVFLLNYFGII